MKKVLTDEDVATIAGIAAQKAIEVYRGLAEAEDRKRAREESKARKAKRLLASYRRIKATLDDTVMFTEDEMMELGWKFLQDLMGSADSVVTKTEAEISAMEAKRRQDMYGVQCVERAVEYYRKECEKSGNQENMRRYREVWALYMQERPATIEEVAQLENVSKNTVYRDLDIACEAISIYMLGA